MKKVGNTKFFSNRIVFVLLLVSLMSSALISVVNIMHIKTLLNEHSRNSIKTMVQIAANSLDGDLLDSIAPGDENTEEYQKIFGFLDEFRISENVKYIYTMRKSGDEVQFVVDVDDYDTAAVGEAFPTYEEIEQAFAGDVTVDREISRDVWGNYYSAFAPVHNRAGQVVAIVGIDCSLESIEQQIQSVALSLITVNLVGAVVLGILTVIVAQVMAHYVNEASKDGLTGIYNRKYASKFIEKAVKKQQSFGFILLDVDNFKEVNDTCGHNTGDEVLQVLGRILSEHCRSQDIAFRLGGDEFAAFFDHLLTPDQLEGITQRIQQAFKREAGAMCPQVRQLSLSFGGVVGGGRISFDEMYHQADLLLYQVKKAGKGSCLVHTLKQ